MDKLEDIRKRINGIDAKMADLFEQRMVESRKVAEIKMANGLAIVDPAREAEVIRTNSALIGDAAIREYYVNFVSSLMSGSKAYQQRLMRGMRVAYSGVPGAFSYIAAANMFPDAQLISYPDFAKAYETCSTGECDAVVLPLENSFAGEVSTVTDLMFWGNLYVNQVMQVEAVQNLLAYKGATIDGIKTVYSHPQALQQCSDFIEAHNLECREYSNTALAAQMVADSGDASLAAIGSVESAELYGLQVIESHINTSSSNTTRFAAFSRVLNLDYSRRKMGKHFLLMFTVKNEAGALAKTLNIIGAHNYNMYNLQSRPMKELIWNYYFFMELEGDITTEDGSSMMRELGTICDNLKLVGSFYLK